MPTIGAMFGTWEEEQRMVRDQARVAATPTRFGQAESPAVRRAQLDFQDAWVGVNSQEPHTRAGIDARLRYRNAVARLADLGAPSLPAGGLTMPEREAILRRNGVPLFMPGRSGAMEGYRLDSEY